MNLCNFTSCLVFKKKNLYIEGVNLSCFVQETLVKVQVHREEDEDHHGLNPLASSSSGSSLSSFSSAVSLEAKRRAEVISLHIAKFSDNGPPSINSHRILIKAD